jgi:DMSO/TMAO reductase YedYZ heme-binding membrane subunit
MATTDVGTGQPRPAAKARAKAAWRSESLSFSAGTIRKQSLILILLRLPAFLPLLFMLRGWFSANQSDVLTLTEADVLGTGGEICFFFAITITPLITLTGQQWIAPLRRWYGIMFAVIGIADGTTAAITTEFAGGVFGRLAGHTFLLSGLFIVLMALPLLATANTPAQRKLGRHWKTLQKTTYAIWGMIVLHLLLLDGFGTFGTADGDGDPIMHQRFYQAVAISIPLLVLRLPPVRRWVLAKRAEGRAWQVWWTMAPLVALFLVGMFYIINEEIFTGTMMLTIRPPAN